MLVNNKELAVEIDGDGPAVLLVHGLGATSNFYQVQAGALAAHHRVIRVNSARPHRRSSVVDAAAANTSDMVRAESPK